jgi:predicted amidohydrolase
VVIDADGTLLGAHRKMHLFGDEWGVCQPGRSAQVFETRLGRIGVIICYDLEFPELAPMLAVGGAQILVVCTANMEPSGTSAAVASCLRLT